MRLLDSLTIGGRRVLVRVDYNVPLDKATGQITDDTRIRASLPTLRAVLSAAPQRVLLLSHLGRPKGPDPAYSVRSVAGRLSQLLGEPVPVLPYEIEEAGRAAAALHPGAVALLENTRFYPGEEQNSPELAVRWAALGDVYINDAFGAAHRAHASTEALAHLLPSGAGLLLQREVEVLTGLMASPDRPFVAVLGGAKVSDKIAVIRRLLQKVDRLLIGGAMANTFMLAKGMSVGSSLAEPDKQKLALELLHGPDASRLILPMDVVTAPALDQPEDGDVRNAGFVPDDRGVYDIGPRTAAAFAREARSAATLFWNGPMGVFEIERFARGTLAVARAAADCPGFTVVGGGDSVAAIEAAGVAPQIDHISTGGGASLELLEGRVLPGVAALGGA